MINIDTRDLHILEHLDTSRRMLTNRHDHANADEIASIFIHVARDILGNDDAHRLAGAIADTNHSVAACIDKLNTAPRIHLAVRDHTDCECFTVVRAFARVDGSGGGVGSGGPRGAVRESLLSERIRSAMSSGGLEGLQRAVTAIRGEHRGCDPAACPWPTMYDEDVNELNEALAACGYAVTNEIHPDRSCPDGGTCHHECRTGACFRVGSCGPLTGVYPGDQWPESVIRAEADNDEVYCDQCGKPGRSLCEDCVTRRTES